MAQPGKYPGMGAPKPAAGPWEAGGFLTEIGACKTGLLVIPQRGGQATGFCCDGCVIVYHSVIVNGDLFYLRTYLNLFAYRTIFRK